MIKTARTRITAIMIALMLTAAIGAFVTFNQTPAQTAYAYSVGNTFTQGNSYTFSESVYFYDEVSESTVTLSGELSYTGTNKESNYVIFYFFNMSTETMYSFRALYGDASSVPNSFVIISGSGTSGDPFHINFATRTAPHIHEGVTFTAWESNNSLPSSPGSYYLTKDVTISGTWWAPVGTTNLCLNGHGIKKTGSGSVIWAKDYKQKVLNLYDCGSTVHYYDVDENDMAINIDETAGVGRKSFTGGYIAGGERTDSYGGAIWVEVATFNMYGGTILGNKAGIGGGVYVSTQGTFNMYGGTIMHNKASGDIYSYAGGGVQLFEGCTFNMYGGDISYNYSAKSGGGVAFSNYADHFTMSGGTISHNNAVTKGGGVYKPTPSSKFYLSGNPVIGDNTANSANNNVYINNTYKDVLTLSGALTEGASVGVTLYSGSGVFTDGWSDSMDSANPATYFVPDNDMYDIILDSGEAKLAAHIHNDITFTAWDSDNSLPTAGNYYLTKDVVLSGTHYFSNDVSLCLNGHSITTTGSGAVLGTNFSDSLTFNLYDCDDTEHKYCIHDYLAVVDDSLTENYETFKGGYITGGKNGAVDNKATFNMYGGTLIGNTGSSPAVGSEKVFRMYGGAIIGNYATGMGAAGVGASNNNQDASHIYLYGGKIIENTSAGYGGGVMPGAYTYSKYVVGSLEGHEALIVRDNYALKGTYNQDYYHESNVFVWRSSDHPLITMEFQNATVTPEIGITVDDNVAGRVFASSEDYPDYYSSSWINYFFSDDLNYEAAINTDSEEYYGDFYLKALPPHEHDFDCSAEGATLTLVCKNTDRRCGLENCTITLTLVAPTLTQQGGKGNEEATISGLSAYSSATDKTIYVDYYRTGDSRKLDFVPNTQGNYTAKITLGGATASLDYEIAAPVEHLYVADVDMFTVAGGVVNAQTDGVVGSLSGSATLTYGETENDLILTLNDFVYVGSGHEEELFGAERSSAIWATFYTEKTLKSVFDGQNSITYSRYGMLFLSESNLDVSFEGTGSFHMEDQEYGCAIFFRTASSELNINSGSYDISSGYVFDGPLRGMNVNGGTFHAVAKDGNVLSTESFTMTDGVFDVEATKDEMSVAIRGVCSIRGGEFTVRAHRAQEYAISAMGLYGSLTVTGGVVNIWGEDVGVELYADMNGALNVSGGVVTIQGGVYGCDGYEGAPAQISGGEITIIGGMSAVSEDVVFKNTVPGLGWTNVDATEGEEAIYIADEQGQTINADLKNLQLPKTLHNHAFTYTASGATITATCGNAECYVTEGLTLTLVAPSGDMVYDGNARVATIAEGYSEEVFKDFVIKYYKNGTEVASCIDAGDYVAKVTVGGKTAEVSFTIENWTIVDEEKGVAVEIEGAEEHDDIIVEVEVKTDISSEQSQTDYSEAVKDKIGTDKEIALVYNVKLIQITNVGGVETKTEIQPSDIKPGTTVVIRMDIPEQLRGKNFKLLHIHSADDIEYVENFTVSRDGTYLTVRVNRLSDFAFVVDKNEAKDHGLCIGWIAFILACLALVFFLVWLLLCKKELLKLIGLIASCTVLLSSIIVIIVHTCIISIIALILATIAVALFALFFLVKNGKEEAEAEVAATDAANAEAEKDEEEEEEEEAEFDEEAGFDNESDLGAGVGLKESLAIAAGSARGEKITKATIAAYLERNYASSVEINRRDNYTKTGLPLADTHYVTNDGAKTCFIYVYETEGATMLLLKTKDELGEELRKEHSTVRRSAFPKSKDSWYSVILDDSLTNAQVEDMIDRTIAVCAGKTIMKPIKGKSPVRTVKKVTVAEAGAMISDEVASEHIEIANNGRRHVGKKDIVNVDTLSDNFNDGDTVTLDVLKAKKLVPANSKQVKLLARGELDKKLHFELQDYSIEAVKMVIATGGTVKIV